MTDECSAGVTRRIFTQAMLAGMLCAHPMLAAAASDSHQEDMLRLLDDPLFHRGVNVAKIKPGTLDIEGVLQPGFEPGLPVWRLAQWYSHYDLLAAKAERLADESVRYFDGAKSIAFGRAKSDASDLIFALNGPVEYGGVSPAQGDAWPHLLVEQRMATNVALPNVRQVRLAISYRLLKAEAHRDAGWSDARHTAQFQIFLTIQNLNRASSGYGDYLWFGVPFFDARYPVPPKFSMKDASSAKKAGTGKFIFSAGGDVFGGKRAIDGDWITLDQDVMPLMKEALAAAWDAGFLPASRDMSDYRIGGMNMGWEVTGLWDVAMQVRGLGLSEIVSAA